MLFKSVSAPRKSYDALDFNLFLLILMAYGVGPRMTHLVQTYWAGTKMVAWSGSYYGDPFMGTREVTQGYPLSPTI